MGTARENILDNRDDPYFTLPYEFKFIKDTSTLQGLFNEIQKRNELDICTDLYPGDNILFHEFYQHY